MSLLSIILGLIIIGVLLWIINRFIPMAGSIKAILNVFVVLVVVIWLLQQLGLIDHILNVPLK